MNANTKTGNEYNGYPSWTAWNVHLWITSHEDSHRLCQEYGEKYGAKVAAEKLLNLMPEKTPDGARFTNNSLRIAIEAVCQK